MEQKIVRRPRRDFLSRLPDDVLCHILSYLPTSQAILTSVLSTRWRHLWKFTPCLDLDHEDFVCSGRRSGRWGFCQFVSHVMSTRHPAAGVRRFRLHWLVGQQDQDIQLASRWLDVALRQDSGGGGLLRELELHLFTFKGFPLETILHQAPSLEQLKLATDCHQYLVFEHPPCLWRLRTLHLRRFRSYKAAGRRLSLPEYAPHGSLEVFITGCPLLEDLSLEECSFRRLRVSAPRLVRLAVKRDDHRHGEGIDVEAPALRSVHYASEWRQKAWRLRGPTGLLEASLDLFFVDCMDLRLLVGALGEGARTLKSLVLRFVDASKQPPEEYPVFGNLKILKLFILIKEETIRAVIFLLLHSPALETLEIEYCQHGGRLKRGNWRWDEEEFVESLKACSKHLERVVVTRKSALKPATKSYCSS